MIKTFFYCCFISLIIAVPAAFFSKPIWGIYLDKTPPQITVLTSGPRIGVGSAGGKLEIEVSDNGPGLDEVVVRLRQLRSDRELFRKKLGGIQESKLTIDIAGQGSASEPRTMVGEGSGEIEIVAFDRSFYNNRAVVTAKAFVDTKPPRLEVFSAQHNLRQGGAQMVVYSAHDENLTFSGVRVGATFFKGFPAGQLDSALNREGLFAALYTVPIGSSIRSEDVKVMAVDIGGNTVEQPFYNKIARRAPRILGSSNARLVNWLIGFPLSSEVSAVDDGIPAQTGEDSSGDNQSDINKKIAAIDATTLVQNFDKVIGTALLVYGDTIKLPQKSGLDTGSLFVFTGLGEARALHPGEISSVKVSGNSFYEVSIAHGLGLSTVYKGLKKASVQEGQHVISGDVLGSVDSYLGVGALVSGYPVDLTEWWSQDWVSSHIYEKIQEVKKSLGIVEE